ncbi:unnamed protein product [Rotaria magnacalcarata]|uniref:Uncharacterized protein n=1 Tax=Rotaria magnacalcarata TaxID=392030 RepID=A0A816UX06_9BILA|nr:unnamed protein product [Rotaria magnacalcarata]
MPDASLLTIPSLEPKCTRKVAKNLPRYVHYFTMNYEQWRKFYDAKIDDVYSGWGNQLMPHLAQLKVYCTIIFRYHHVRAKHSRKKNSSLFSAAGCCKHRECPVTIEIEIENEPKHKGNPCVFKVTVTGDARHDPKNETAARPLTGAMREAMAKRVHQIGALGVFEHNVKFADEDLLQEGNFSEVPSLDVLKTAKQQYHKKYRLDEDNFKELRMYGFFTRFTDYTSKCFKGYIQTSGEWLFTVHFFAEVQVDRFVKYCKTEKYPCIHIDATGSVVRKFQRQKDVFFYSMVFKDNDSSIMSLSGTLLTDHTVASITSYFNCLRSKLAMRSKSARPSFVVIDFSAALINSVLASFNVENIHSYLRRCYNTIDRTYDTKQLQNMTFLRLRCSHAMKAFSRSLFKLNVSKDNRHALMSLFAVLLNSTNFHGALSLYVQIILTYGDPNSETSPDALKSLLSKSDLSNFDVNPFLEEKDVQDDKSLTQDFLDELDITTDPIIHQSPFNVKACDGIPALRRIMEKQKLDIKPSNSLYSIKIIQLFHKWFAYLPLWSCIMTDFFDRQFRYANDKKAISTDDWEFGRRRVSNATIETYFRTVKLSVLENHTNLRPTDFLMRNHKHTFSRFKADQFDVPHSSHGRKKKGAKAHDLNVKDAWRRRAPSNAKAKRAYHFSDIISQTAACQLADEEVNNSIDSNNYHSFGFSVVSANQQKKAESNVCNSRAVSPSSSQASLINPLSMKTSLSSDSIFSTLLAISDSNNMSNAQNRINQIQNVQQRVTESRNDKDFASTMDNMNLFDLLSPKRSHPSSDSSVSTMKQKSKKMLQEVNVNSSPSASINKCNFKYNKDHRTAKIGSLTLAWPLFRIGNASFRGQNFSVVNNCPIDTGLFVFYHAYKAGTNNFRNLFEVNNYS